LKNKAKSNNVNQFNKLAKQPSKEFLNIKDTLEKKLIFNLPASKLTTKLINSNNCLNNKNANSINPAINKLQKNNQKQNSTLTESSSGSNSLNKSSKTRSSNNSISKKHFSSFKKQEKSIGRLCRSFESNKTTNNIHIIKKSLESNVNKTIVNKIEIPKNKRKIFKTK